jgi:4-amino-4-deoxy-L-arabinose transferase-like glycosyltransferase
MGRVGARAIALMVLVLALHAVLVWLAREPGLLTREDDIEYMTLAQSLRHGGYNELFRVDAPLHAQYPPVYPALLAVWGAVFGDGYAALTAFTLLLSLTMLVLVFVLVRRFLGEGLALLAVAVLAVNPWVVRYGGSILSETPYTLLTVLAFMALARLRPDGRGIGAVTVLVLLAALTRSAGVTLVVAVGAYLLLERRWRAALWFGVVAAVVLGAWFGWTVRAPEQYIGASYIADIGAGRGVSRVTPLPLRIPLNEWWYLRTGIPWILAVPTIPGTPIDNGIMLLMVASTSALGLWVFARRWRPGLLYAVVYGGLLSVWVWQVERFVVPVLYMLVAAMLAGAYAIGMRFGRRGPWFAGVVGAVLLLGGGYRSVALALERSKCALTPDGLPPAQCVMTDQASFFEAVRWVRANTPQDAVVLAAKAAPLWHYTGRRTVGYPLALAQSDEAFLPFLREQGASWILLGSLQLHEPARLLDAVEANCANLTVAAFFPARTWLFSLRPPASEAEAERSCRAAAEYRELNRDRDFARGR